MWLIHAFNLYSSAEVEQRKYWDILFQVTPLPLSCQRLLLEGAADILELHAPLN